MENDELLNEILEDHDMEYMLDDHDDDHNDRVENECNAPISMDSLGLTWRDFF